MYNVIMRKKNEHRHGFKRSLLERRRNSDAPDLT